MAAMAAQSLCQFLQPGNALKGRGSSIGLQNAVTRSSWQPLSTQPIALATKAFGNLQLSNALKSKKFSRPFQTAKARRRRKCISCCSNSNAEPEEKQNAGGNVLKGVVRRKQVKLNAELQRLGTDGLEEKLRSVPRPKHPNRLLELIAGNTVRGKTTLVAEIGRASPSETSEQLAERAALYVSWGADAVAVSTDEELTSDGQMDLATVCHRLGTTPVLCRDWVLHPIQIVDIARSGASGFNLVQAVLGEGTPALLTIALATGLDPIVEVVNKDELEKVVGNGGATLFGINLSVGLSVSIPGFRQDVAKSLVQQLPFGAASIVGVSSVDEARVMKAAGTDVVWLKREALQPGRGDLEWEERTKRLFEQLSYVLIGDD